MKTKRRHQNTQRLAIALMATGVLGLIVRFTVKDRWIIFAPVFYGLPPLVVVVFLVLSGGLFVRWRKRRLAAVAFVGAVISTFVWVRSDYVHAVPPDRMGEGFTVVFWNIGGLSTTKEIFVPALKEANGQIVVLAESGKCGEDRRQFWLSHFPGYHVCLLGGGLALLSKYPISDAAMHKIERWTRIGVYDLETPFGMVSVVVPDIVANPFVSRRPSINRAYEIATSRPYPTIVLGDFNTPHSSVLFGDFRRTYQHAFEEAGSGLITTWPALFPVLALDHIWLSEHFVPLRTSLRRTFRSDHALVVADVQLREYQNQPTEDPRPAYD